MITVADVRTTLGEAYSIIPDDATIQEFINRRLEELQDLIGTDPASAPHKGLLKKWLINRVCMDVIAWDLTGISNDDALDYSIGELRESRSENVKMKLTYYESFKESAELALNTYFIKTLGYRAVRL